ncbi:MAG: ACT domain-containing protein [Candidatus Nanoarchaeia archaeon]
MKGKTSIAQLTQDYIKQNPAISYCLKKEILSYAKLSKFIAKELNTEKKSSLEAISIASIRYEKEIKNNINDEIKIKQIFKQSTLDIKTNIAYILVKKGLLKTNIIEEIKKFEFVYLTQTKNHYLIIFEESNREDIDSLIEIGKCDYINSDMVFLLLKTSKNIEKTPGVVGYLMGLLTEQKINIYEFVSCYDTTYLLIHKSDFPKTYEIIEKIMK